MPPSGPPPRNANRPSPGGSAAAAPSSQQGSNASSLAAELMGILGVSEEQAKTLLEASNHDLNRAAELPLTRGAHGGDEVAF